MKQLKIALFSILAVSQTLGAHVTFADGETILSCNPQSNVCSSLSVEVCCHPELLMTIFAIRNNGPVGQGNMQNVTQWRIYQDNVLRGMGDLLMPGQDLMQLIYDQPGLIRLEVDQEPGFLGSSPATMSIQCDFATPTPTPTATPTPTTTPTPTNTPTATPTPSNTPTTTPTPTSTPTPSITPTPSLTPTPTPSLTPTPTPTPENEIAACSITATANNCENGQSSAAFDASLSTGRAPLNYLWTYSCVNSATNAQVNANVVNLTNSSLAVTLTEPAIGTQIICTGQVTVTDGNGTQKGCSATKAINPCELGCDSTDIRPLLIQLDGNTIAQQAVVKEAVRALRNLSGKKKVGIEALVEAQSFHQASWEITWSLPQFINNCSNEVLCGSVSTTDTVQQYNGSVDSLKKLAFAVAAQVEKLTVGNAKRAATRIRRKATKAHKAGLKLSAQVPETSSQCSGSVL